MKKKNINFDELLESWPSPFVARCKIDAFTRGLYKGSTIRTHDAANTGIAKKYKIGNSKIFYKAEDVVDWLKAKSGN